GGGGGGGGGEGVRKEIMNIGELKAYLAAQGVEIRVC
ncbi:hypothetical protein ACP6PF_25705, partial [Klebsiella pneumoniae]